MNTSLKHSKTGNVIIVIIIDKTSITQHFFKPVLNFEA